MCHMSYRSRIITVVLVLLCAQLAHANVPSSITVQGRLTDGTGTPLPAGSKDFSFRIFTSPGGGSQIWPSVGAETQSISTDADGLWTAPVGAVVPLPDSVFNQTVRWLEITVDDGINPVTTLPRVLFRTGPYAHRVSTVDGATGGEISSKVSIGALHTNTGEQAFVAGHLNAVTGDYSVVGGGRYNYVYADYATIAGGGAVSKSDSNHASGYNSTISGGQGHLATNTGAVIGGGEHNTVEGRHGVVGGGFNNSAADDYATVPGGRENQATGRNSVVGGGAYSYATGPGTTVSGGDSNSAGGTFSVVGGGDNNTASSSWSTISGGERNSTDQWYSTVGGGTNNEATGTSATVAGGESNVASSSETTVGGGQSNSATVSGCTIAGGRNNEAGALSATVGGGDDNVADGLYATIPGGQNNLADGAGAFAAGRNAHALHNGSFVWNSDAFNVLASTAANQFLIPSDGGVGIGTNNPQGGLHVTSGPNNNGLYITAGGRDVVWPNGQNFQFGQWDGTTFSERARFNGGGYLGINTTNATNVLTLPNFANSGGRGLANSWDTYSSRRWKHDIRPITDALETVKQLQGVHYKHNSDNTDDIGLIAEDVGAVLPQLVQFEDNGVDARSLDYARLVAVLIEAVKEQNARIDQLTQQVEQLTQ
ncbi:MAG: hypothetical protein GF341_11580 [candidate division Zixibacteria bacterium]|nr:hypothetical protein [candidate division Zixibacteria bacterium]